MKTNTSIENLEFAPKYIQIRETIRRQVHEGTLPPCAKIPSDAELMARHGVSRITVVNALRDLVREGLLTRKAPQGTFVAANPNGRQRPGVVALFLRTSGHIFGEMAHALIGKIQTAGLHPLIFSPDRVTTEADRQRLRALLDEDLRYIVIQGYFQFPFSVLREKPACFQRLIFIEMCETDLSFPGARKVIVDYEKAGYMVIDRLLSLGHSRIMLYSHQPKPERFRRLQDVLNGCRRAYDRHHLSYEKLFRTIAWLPSSKPAVGDLHETLNHRERPTAAFCFQDSHAREVYAAARQLGLTIPGDLAVVGFFNTPWCELFDPPLTSVSIHEERMGGIVGDIVTGALKTAKETMTIEPSLIIRGSCGTSLPATAADERKASLKAAEAGIA